mgnify:CR=1 FL=1
MIKINKGNVQISGNGLQISSEFSMLVRSLLKMKMESGTPEEIAKDMIRHDFETGLKSEEEIHKEAEAIKSEINMSGSEVSKAIADLLDSIFGGKSDDDN